MRKSSRNGARVASLSVLLLSLGPALVAEAFLVPASSPSLPIGGLLRPRQPSAPLAVSMSSAPSLGLGFDFGTSGVSPEAMPHRWRPYSLSPVFLPLLLHSPSSGMHV